MCYISVGISGSGKSTYLAKLGCPVVCMDDIRKELTGNVSDQSKNREVFLKACIRVRDNARHSSNFAISATNLSLKSVRSWIKVLPDDYSGKIILLVFMDSYNPRLCKARVKYDLSKGVDRSDTVNITRDGKELIDIMADKFKQLIPLLQKNEIKDKFGRPVEIREIYGSEEIMP